MNKKLETELYKAGTLAFEELAFLLPSLEINEQQLNAQVEAAASVEFNGPFSGKLLVRICGGILPVLTANMMGEEKAPSKNLQYDALTEITNVICGNMLPGIAGSTGIFHVSVPTMDESFNMSPPVAEVQLGLGQGRADLLLFVSKYPGLEE
jgi:hypothetical protein